MADAKNLNRHGVQVFRAAEAREMHDTPMMRKPELDAAARDALPEFTAAGGTFGMHEAAALAAATTATGTDRVRIEDFSIRFLAPAFVGPFVATATLLSRPADDVLCQVELVDRGADERIRSLSTMRIRVQD